MTFHKYTFACFIESSRQLDVAVILKAFIVAILSNLFHFTFFFLGGGKLCFFTGFDVFVLKHEKNVISLCFRMLQR